MTSSEPDPGPDTRAAENALRRLLQRASAPPGATIGPYRVLHEIGRGGMGIVYRAETTGSPPVPVALKVMRPGLIGGHAASRFESEVESLAAMDHEAIAKVHGAGHSADGEPYLAMELVDGVPITTFCDEHELALADRIALFRRVCAGVEHAHRRGVIHRDLKPGNVLVADRDGAPMPKIIDFGLARALERATRPGAAVTEAGVIQGTRGYMSPEQAAGRTGAIDTRSDVYALGVMLHELLTGELPFPPERVRELSWGQFERLLHDEPMPRPSLTLHRHRADERARSRSTTVAGLTAELRRDLDWIVLKATAKEPDQRYASPNALAEDLGRYLDGRPVAAGPPSAWYRVRKFVRRHRLATIAVSAVLASSLIAVSASIDAAAAERVSAAVRKQLLLTTTALGVTELSRAVTQDAIPETPSNIALLREWRSGAHAVKSRMGEPLAELREQIRLAGVESDTWVVRGVANLDSSFKEVVASIDRVERGLAWAESVIELTCTVHAKVWQDCARRIAADIRFHGLQLPPQPGLVPIGPDHETGFEEFAFLRSGTMPTRDPASGELRLGPDSAIVLTLLPGGEATVGARPSDPGARDNEQPATAVRLDPFFIGKHEVSQAQWIRLDDGRNPSSNPPNLPANAPDELKIVTLQHPVESMTWFEAWHLMTRMGLSLPTEAQWEYAARAGTDTVWWTGNDLDSLRGNGGRPPACNLADKRLWDFRFSNKDTPFWKDFDDGFVPHAPIGSFRPNPFGLHDTIGNVREWMLDPPAPYSQGIEAGTGRVLRGQSEEGRRFRTSRGGAWNQGPAFSRVAHREIVVASFRLGSTGVRVVRAIDR